MAYIEKLLRIRKTLADSVDVEQSGIQKNWMLIDYLFEHYVCGVTLITSISFIGKKDVKEENMFVSGNLKR